MKGWAHGRDIPTAHKTSPKGAGGKGIKGETVPYRLRVKKGKKESFRQMEGGHPVSAAAVIPPNGEIAGGKRRGGEERIKYRASL